MATHVAQRRDLTRVAQEEREVRVEDYLNDKLQTTADLAGIDALLEDVRRQQGLLDQQVRKVAIVRLLALTCCSCEKHRTLLMTPPKPPKSIQKSFFSRYRRLRHKPLMWIAD